MNIENRIFNPEAEQLPGDTLRDLQTKRLKKVVQRVSRVPFYKNKFSETGISAQDITRPEDVRKLPFTTKADLRSEYPLGFMAVDRGKVLRYHGSSGTTGKPTFVVYTKKDLNTWSKLCARFLTAGGLRPEHTVQIAFGYGLFTGGFGLHYGVERAGAGVIPASSGNTRRQIMLLQDLDTDVLVSTPSYALNLAEVLEKQGISPDGLALSYAHFGGEPWTAQMGEEIESRLGIHAFNNYGLSEVIGPGVSGECVFKTGMHIQEDHFLVECIDPETLEPVQDGCEGELVFTTLTREAMPLLRYRTRDIAQLDHTPCECGRTGVRMSRVTGRTDDMLIIRGVNVYPSQVEEALLEVEQTAPHYHIDVTRTGALDEATVTVEMNRESFSDKMSDMQQLHDLIARKIQAVTRVRMNVNLVEPDTLDRFTGKAERVTDRRKEDND